MIDATYKLNELRLPLYLMFIVDSNGQSEIVGIFLTVIETQEAITRMVGAFNDRNTKFSSTEVVMTTQTTISQNKLFFKQIFQMHHLSLSHTSKL